MLLCLMLHQIALYGLKLFCLALLIESVLLTTCSAYLLEHMEFFLGGMGSRTHLIVRWRESCLCLPVEPLCLLGQPCCFQLQQLACWDSNSWGDSRWGDGWLCGFTLGRGLPGTVSETGHIASRILTSMGGGIATIALGSIVEIRARTAHACMEREILIENFPLFFSPPFTYSLLNPWTSLCI